MVQVVQRKKKGGEKTVEMKMFFFLEMDKTGMYNNNRKKGSKY
jgi:hypothetical protein